MTIEAPRMKIQLQRLGEADTDIDQVKDLSNTNTPNFRSDVYSSRRPGRISQVTGVAESTLSRDVQRALHPLMIGGGPGLRGPRPQAPKEQRIIDLREEENIIWLRNNKKQQTFNSR